MLYRVKTKKYTQSWLDFVIYEENGEMSYKHIGGYYYGMISYQCNHRYRC